ncbi:hypothetical protein E9Q43_004110 [Escherichia coli]|nr:hypothetical protein [Escherichia coli]EEY6957919.1 hypothetical protein [Escherichia coli]EEY7819443.1 hypothetical protein [Escherichia coli]
MKIRSQVGMVLNLDKCIGCHTCSVTCKNVWTGREGMEYAWFNNVETKPGIGYPKNWEDQEEWQGGWVRDVNGKIRPRLGSKMGVITKIFANPVVPQIDDYYEPFTFDYEHLHSAPEGKHIPTARPRSLIDGKRMDKVIWGPNWEELLGGEFEKRARDRNFEAMQKEMYRYLAIANYEDRFVIPTSHREMAGDAFAERNGCGFTFGDGCHGSDSKFNLFNSSRIDAINITEVRDKAEGE